MSIQALVPAQLRHCGVQQMGVIYPAQDKAALPTCCLQGSAKLLANTAQIIITQPLESCCKTGR